MSEDLVNIMMNIHQFNQDLTSLNIKYAEEIERLNNIIKEAKEFIYENAYDSERKNCIDDLWGEIPKLLEILDKGDSHD